MSELLITPRHAWQPITPRGAAAFAAAPLSRLLLVQFIVALLVAATVVAFVSSEWFPVVRDAAQRLPNAGAIRSGTLQWATNAPVRLAEGRRLALSVEPNEARLPGGAADVEVSLHDTNFQVSSWLGYVELPYPSGWTISLTRAEAVPWWGAWEWPLRWLLAAAVVIVLMPSWWMLAAVYCALAKASAFYANRRLGWWESWKLSGAALMPGAFVVMVAILGYGWLGLDLIQLGLFFILHVVTGWLYLVASPFFLPKDTEAPSITPNPFAAPESADTEIVSEQENPFAEPD